MTLTPELGLLAIALAAALAVAVPVLGPGLAVGAIALARRRRPPPLLGPLFGHELTRLARGGLQPRLRALYAGVLLVGLLAAFLAELREVDPLAALSGRALLPLDRSARVAERNFAVFVYCQLAAVTLLAPVLAAGAVTDERDRGTLDYLRASLLSNRELVVGKLAARLVFVGGVALTGLPVLTLTTLLGGVDPLVQAAAFAVAVAYAVSLSAYSLWQATRCDSLRQTLFYVYPVVAGMLVCCCFGPLVSPFYMTTFLLDWTQGQGLVTLLGFTLGFVTMHGFMAVGFTLLAGGAVRVQGVVRPRRPQWEPALATALGPAPKAALEPVVRRRERSPVRAAVVPRLREQDPFLWKETHFAARLPAAEGQTLRGVGWGLGGGYALAGGFALFAALVQASERGGSPGAVLGPVVRATAASAVTVLPILAGLRAAGAVGRERQRRTLEILFTLPVDRIDLLRPKWEVAVRWTKWWLVGTAVIGACGAASGGVSLTGLLATAAVVLAVLAFATSFGLWLSIRCGTAGRATVWLLVVLFGLAIGPPILAPLARSAAWQTGRLSHEDADDVAAAVKSISPPMSGWQLPFHPEDGPAGTDAWVVLTAGLTTAVAYTAAAAGFWLSARRRFEREGRD